MACYQISADNPDYKNASLSFETQSECVEQCPEGACCYFGNCYILPMCQCVGDGTVFYGIGVLCNPSPCNSPLP